jgi:hypothetical protein
MTVHIDRASEKWPGRGHEGQDGKIYAGVGKISRERQGDSYDTQ